MATKIKKYIEIPSESIKEFFGPIYKFLEDELEKAPLIEVEYLAKGVRKVKGTNHILANFSTKDTTLFNITKKDNYIYFLYDLTFKAPRLKYIDICEQAGSTLKKHFLLNDDVFLDTKPENPTSRIYDVYSVIKKKTGKVGFKLIRIPDKGIAEIAKTLFISRFNLEDPSVGWN